MNIAVIPARGGSKRIPGKNIRPFSGRPMIAHSIRAALASGVFEHVVVSTDSEEIAAVAREAGAETPFMRPAELADDHTPTAPVLAHAIEAMTALHGAPQYACCLYATAPFVQPSRLRHGLKTLREHGCSAAFSVTTFAFPIFRALQIADSGALRMVWPENELTRSQDLPETYHDAGQFYWVDCAAFLQSGRLYAADARPVVLPRHLVQDIDTLEDWRRAELMYDALRQTGELED